MKSRFSDQYVWLCASVLVLAAVPSYAGGPSAEKAAAAANLRKVVVSDGVSSSEASAIAEYFFYYHENVGCGAPDSVSDTDDSWSVGTRLGFAGELGDPIIISKATGAVSWGGRVCVTDPLAMLGDTDGASRCGLASR